MQISPLPDLPRHLAVKSRFRPAEACEYFLYAHGLKFAQATLNKKRSVGGGPEFFKATNRCILYDRAALDIWAAEVLGNPVASTSELPKRG